MGKFNSNTIKKVMQEINMRYFLPDLQREFVWLSNEKEERIERLFDSLMRGYPISSFLFWKLQKDDIASPLDLSSESEKEKLNFQLYKFIGNYDAQSPHNEKVDIRQINFNDLYIVLDGQQRLTSFYLGLRGSRKLKRKGAWKNNNNAYESKSLYLNLRYNWEEDKEFSEVDSMYEFKFLSPKEAQIKDDKQNWFRVGKVLEIKDIDSYPEDNQFQPKEAKKIRTLYNVICDKENIVFFEEDSKDLTKVLNIFIRINSGGMQLSYSDLLMSILTNAFSSDIRQKINEEVDNAKDSGFECFSRDHLLKTALFLTECNHKFKLENFNKENIKKIESNQNKIFKAVRDAIQLIIELGYKNALSSGYIISVIAYWFYKKNITLSSIKGDEFKAMAEFVRETQILRYFTTSLDTKLSNVKEALTNANSFRDFLNNMKSLEGDKALKITPDTIDNILSFKYGRDNLLPVLQVLYSNLDYTRNKFHIDHIYPKAQFTKRFDEIQRNKKDYIWNMQLLEGSENISKTDKDPEVWISENYGTEDERRKYLKSNLIDENFILSWDNFEDFEKMRKLNLRNRLYEIFKIPQNLNEN